MCRRCGAELAESTARGYCPNCLFLDGLAEPKDRRAGGRDQEAEDGRAKKESDGEKAEDHSPLAPRPSPLLPSFGNYELLEVIDRGGMGVVYKARQQSLNRVVAVKMLLSGPFAQPQFVQRFRAEAEAVAQLQHPNIVAIHDVGEHEGQPYFSMDYVEGENLAEVISNPKFEISNYHRSARWVKTMAEAVHYAHRRGIVHRDLKPSNVLIDALDQPRITDFGLAKRVLAPPLGSCVVDRGPAGAGRTNGLTLTGQVLGSPNYLPPEQAEGRHDQVGPPSDLYSLGAILYHLLTGRPPFQAESLTALLKEVVETDPVPPRLLNPGIPRDLETVCLKCLEKEIARRYVTAQELADELGRFLDDKPIQARPVSRAGRVWKWCRRRPALASMTAALGLSFALGLIGVSWQWSRASTRELIARRNAYSGDLNLLQAALNEGDYGRAVAHLEATRPAPGQKDLRGWEWRYFWQRCRSQERFRLCQYPEGISKLAFSPDGQWLALRRSQGPVVLWDVTRKRPETELAGVGNPQALSLSPKGHLLGFGNVDHNGAPVVTVWDILSRRERTSFLHPSEVQHLAFSPDATLLATVAHDGQLRLWHLDSHRLMTNFQNAAPYHVANFESQVAFSPQGALLAFGWEKGIRLWEWASGRQQELRWSGSASRTSALAFSPDGRFLAAAREGSSTIHVWDLSAVWDLPADQRAVPATRLEGHRRWVAGLAFSPDGQTLASAGADQSLRLWDLKQCGQIRAYQGHTMEVWAVAFSPDGKDLVSGGQDGAVRYWDPTDRTPPPAYTVLPIPVWMPAFAFGPDGRQFIALNFTNRSAPPSLWDTATLREVEPLAFAGTNQSAVAWSQDGRTLALGDWRGNLRLWDLATRRVITNFAFEGNFISMLRFSCQGGSLLGGASSGLMWGSTNTSKLWRTADWREIPLPAEARNNPFFGAISPDSHTLAVLDVNRTLTWWNLGSGRKQGEFKQSYKKEGGYVAFSPDGRMLASSIVEGFVSLRDVAAGRRLLTLPGNAGGVWGLTFSSDGQRLLTGGGSTNDALRLLDLASQRWVATLPGPPGAFYHLAMSPDGNTVAAVGSKRFAAFWSAPPWAEIEAMEKRPVAP